MPYNVIDPSLAAPAPVTTIGAPLTNVGETLQSFQDELMLMLGTRTDVDATRLAKWINQAYVDVATSLKLEEFEVSIGIGLVAGQPFYRLPYQVSTIKSAAVIDGTLATGGRPLEKIDLEYYRTLIVDSGLPKTYFRTGDVLVLWPTPDQARTVAVDFRARPLPLVAATDSPVLGFEWHEAILLSARKKAFSALLEFDKAAAADNDYVKTVRRREDREASEDENKIPRSSVPGRARGKHRYRSPEPE